MSWLLSLDEGAVNHAAYPGLFLFFTVLVIGTVIAPEVIRIVSSHLAHERTRELVRETLLADAIKEQTAELRKQRIQNAPSDVNAPNVALM